MKHSKKYLKKLKKRLIGCMSSVAICLVLIAGCNLAGLSMPINLLKTSQTTKSNADETAVGANILSISENIEKIELSIRQEYIKIGDNLPITVNVVGADALKSARVENNAFVWTSSNEDVAVVDENGIVTGTGIGHTTITAYNDTLGLKARAIINVYRNVEGAVTLPQVAQVSQVTIVLKEDGTVWATGRNNAGQLGDGTTTDRNTLGQVKIDENTYLTNIRKIAVGIPDGSGQFAAALTLDGKVYTWGLNMQGQLAQGDTTDLTYAKQAKIDANTYIENVIDISAGNIHLMASTDDGEAYIVGGNIGTGTTTYFKNTELTDVIKVEGGGANCGAMLSNGETVCWGANISGDLETQPSIILSTSPYVIAEDAVDIKLNSLSTIIQKENGEIYVTGYNVHGQLGLGDTTDRNVLTKVELPEDENGNTEKIKYISGKSAHLMLMTREGKIYVAGYNGYGQLCTGDENDVNTLIPLVNRDGSKVTDSLLLDEYGEGGSHGLNFIKQDGSIWMSGDNAYGQMGNGTNTSTNYLTPMGTSVEVSMNKRNEYIKTGETLDLDVSGGISKFNVFVNDVGADSESFQTGWDRWTSSNEDVAVVDVNGVVTGTGVGHTTITAYNDTLGIKAKAIINVYRNVKGAVTVPQVVVGEGFTIVLREDGTVWSTGKNDVGQLGDGTTTNRNTLEQVKIDENTYLTNVRKVAVSATDNIVALTKDGQLYGWGSNSNGSLATGDTNPQKYAHKMDIDNNEIIDISITEDCVYTLTNEGKVYGVGKNTNNLLLGVSNTYEFKKLIEFPNAIKIISSGNSCIILQSDGKAYGWGYDNWGELGQGSTSTARGVVKVEENIENIEIGTFATIIEKEDGSFYTTGLNSFSGNIGGLGIGSSAQTVTTFTKIDISEIEDGTRKIISAGRMGWHTILMASDGTVWVTGNNENGQLSTGSGATTTFVQMKNDETTYVTDALLIGRIDTIGDGRTTKNSAIIRRDGTVWMSGDNTYGQMGSVTNTSTNYLTEMINYTEVVMNKRNEYIKTGETLELDVLGGTIEKVNVFVDAEKNNQGNWNRWTSSNEDVAVVDENGIVTGTGIGHTTITAYNDELGLKAKAIINVYRNTKGAVTVPGVASGEGFTIVLKEDGTVWSTGKNDVGQLGDGTTTNRNTLAQVKIDENTYLTNVKKISTGKSHAVALTLDGELYAWGSNLYGELGQGDQVNKLYATKVKSIDGKAYLENIIDVSCGTNETYALKANGVALGCGYDWCNQINASGIDCKLYPTEIDNTKDIITVQGGVCTIATIASNGDVNVKGYNNYGTLGNGTTVNGGSQAFIGTDINEIKLCGYLGAILKEDGTIWTTGYNDYGQLGLGDTSNRTTYTKVKYEDGTDVKAKTISGGSQNLSFIGEDGKVYVTGSGAKGQLSNGGTANAVYPIPMKNADGTDVTDCLLLSKGNGYFGTSLDSSLNMGLIRQDGSIWISGDNTYGQIGNGTNESTNYLTPMGTSVEVSMNKRNKYIKTGEKLNLDVSGGTFEEFNVYVGASSARPPEDGWTWTSSNEDVAVVDENGIVTGTGIGHTTITAYNDTLGLKAKAIINVYRNTKGAVTVPGVASGEGFTIVLKEDGTVWSTGKNDVGQLGDGTTTNRNTLAQVKIDENTYLTNVKKISTGYAYAAALTLDGEVYAWGHNSGTYNKGVLGQGDTVNRAYATKVKGVEGVGYLENIIDIVCGFSTTYALNKEGEIFGTGLNTHNEINDNGGYTLSMVQVTKMNNAIGISAGSYNFGSILANGDVYVKGRNDEGEFGNGTTAVVGGLYLVGNDINEIELHGVSSAILKEDGSVWTTGNNTYGSLGLGDTVRRTTYTKVKYEDGTEVKAKAISNNGGNLQFIGEDGKVYVTGYNGYGQLSNGSTASALYPTPMQNSDGTEVIDCLLLDSGTSYYSLTSFSNMGLIRTDGSIWISGDNTYGQIGNGTNTSTNYLTQMAHITTPSLEKIEMQVGETRTFTEEELTYIRELVNVFGKGEVLKEIILDEGQILDTNIATYANKAIEALAIGNTTLKLQKEGIEINIPVTVVSDDASLGLVEVDDILREPTEPKGKTYEVPIAKLAETAKIRVKAISKYEKVQIGENEEKQGEATVTISLNLAEERITVPVKVTASDGITEENYNIILIRKSNEAGLNRVVVNGEELENIDNVYRYNIKAGEDNAHVEITAKENSNANIKVGENIGIGYLEFDEGITRGTIKIEKKIEVTSEDKTRTEEYTLILWIRTEIIGKITTENYLEEHISTIRLYKRKRKEGEEYGDGQEGDESVSGQEELITELETEKDGTYVVEIDEIGVYDVLVTKAGYLDYKVAEIEIKPGAIVEIQEYKLIGGDVAEDGEIEINDLVDMNRNLGKTITEENREEKGKYDLNEDGKIDKKDREILKKNYGKRAEEEKWADPNAEIALMNLEDDETQTGTVTTKASTKEDATNNNPDALTSNISPLTSIALPMTSTYRISSEYGTRIHPITGEEKLHAGIDLSGEHHTEILAVADGVVTFAGVQNGYGNCIEIKHTINGKTIYTFYAHLSRIDVKPGDTVKKGQIIGLEGGEDTDPNPGTSTGHHLHFEIRTASGSGHAIDPRTYIQF